MSNTSEITDEQLRKEWAEYHAAMDEYYRIESAYNNRILNAVKSAKGTTFHRHILEIIEGAEGAKGKMQIVNTSIGKFQKESHGRSIKGIWVDQHAYGDTGDCWYGTVCVKLKENKYLLFNYSM